MSATPPAISPRMVSQALMEKLDYESVDPDKVLSGKPKTGFVECGVWSGVEVGVWEMTPGSMVDTEVEEVFVVIAGDATLTRTRNGTTESVLLEPGVVCHLEAGEQNRWDVRVALRKVYFAH